MAANKNLNSQGKCTFYITRHGETVWNRDQIIQGHKDSPLTENGVSQAKSTAQKLQSVSFDRIFSSDLMRAYRTAEIIAADHDLAIKTNKLLRETSFSHFEGKKVAYFLDAVKKAIDYREQLSSKEQMTYKIHPDLESYEEMASRMITFIRQVAIAYANQKMLVVTHSGVMRAFLIKIGCATNQELPHGKISNAGYAVIESDGADFIVKETEGIEKI